MKSKLKAIFKEHESEIQPLLNSNKFDLIYELLETEVNNGYLFGYNLCRVFTESLLEVGINPLFYMEKVPNGFLFESSNVEEIFIPKNIRYIGYSAFESSKIKIIDIAENSNLAEIQSEAFCNCTNLKKINLPETLQTIESEAFYLNNMDIYYDGSEEQFKELNIDEDAFGANCRFHFK